MPHNHIAQCRPRKGAASWSWSAGAALTDYCTLVKENAYSCNSRLDAPNRAGCGR